MDDSVQMAGQDESFAALYHSGIWSCMGPVRVDPIARADNDLVAATSSVSTSLFKTVSGCLASDLSRPTLQTIKSSSFTPPTRPSSTPFPHIENRSPTSPSLEGFKNDFKLDTHIENSTAGEEEPVIRSPQTVRFDQLPIEVHEAILDHLFGYCVSPTSSSAMNISSLTQSRNTTLRHSRRKELTRMALVNHTWRVLVQQRLYRHIKLKATVESLEAAVLHLAYRDHLASSIKHIEVWFPVFQPTYTSLALSNSLALPTVTTNGLTNTMYTLPADNCTLEDVFRFVALQLPQVRVLTLEGGERRKAPQVRYFNNHPESNRASKQRLKGIDSVRTLVTKGQWNIMRNNCDFDNILMALPNLEEWQGSYSKPKSKSYLSLSSYLPNLPIHVTSLRLCLENDYRRESVVSPFYLKVAQRTHVCKSLAKVLPTLEHFTYTGRVCHSFFETASSLVDPLTSRLRSVDLTVKNCCRRDHVFQDSGSGIQDMSFIEAFEQLVLAGVRSLEKFEKLRYLRIRFVDLDSVLPPLNPFFRLKNEKCSGVWSSGLLDELARVRPEAVYTELSETFGDIVYSKEGRMLIAPEHPRARITSLKLSNYRSLATRMTIQ